MSANRAFLIPIVTHAWTCVIAAVALSVSMGVRRFARTPLSATDRRPYERLRPSRKRMRA
jgi:hypothetical protein